MASLQDLLSASQIGSRAATYASPGQPTGGTNLFDTLKDVGGVGLGAVASVGNVLDLPGSSVRDLFAGENPFDQWLSPLQDTDRTTGRQLLEGWGMRKNEETGIGGWFSDPGEGLRDLAGFGAEVVLDPFGPVVGAAMGAVKGTTLGIKAVSAASRAHPLAKLLGRTAVNVFDKLPMKAQKELFKGVGRGVSALLDRKVMSVTDAAVQPMAREVTEAADKVMARAAADAAEIALTANNVGYNLHPDLKLDPADPATWLRDDSVLKTNAREMTIRRYLDGVYNPDDAQLMSGDLVTIGESADIHAVEFVDRTLTGAKVKLVNRDELIDDTALKPAFMQQKDKSLELPEELKAVLDVQLRESDALQLEAQGVGLKGLGDNLDRYGGKNFYHRLKSDQLRQIEAVTGLDPKSWRKGYNSIVATLSTPGGRELQYKGFTGVTAGVNELFADKYMQKLVERLHSESELSANIVDGVQSRIMRSQATGALMVGPRHFETLAESLGMTSDELWLEVAEIPRTRKTGASAFPDAKDTGQFTLEENGLGLGYVKTVINGDTAELSHTLPAGDIDRGVLNDTLLDIERSLHEKNGVNKVVINAPTDDAADKLWKGLGYTLDGTPPSGGSRWIKNLYNGLPGVSRENMGSVLPMMMDVDEAMKRLSFFRDQLADQINTGAKKGESIATGWWTRFDNLRDTENKGRLNLNAKVVKAEMTKLELDTLNLIQFRPSGVLQQASDFEKAKAALEAGREVYYGRHITKKGEPAVSILVSPTTVSTLEKNWTKISDGLKQAVKDSPLLLKETTYDHLHRAISRNYDGRIDRWMPELTKPDGKGYLGGMARASTTEEILHEESIGGWHKAFLNLHKRMEIIDPGTIGKDLTKPMNAIMRMDDETLKALLFTDANIKTIHTLREKYNGKLGLLNEEKLNRADLVKDPIGRSDPGFIEATRPRDLLTQDAAVPLVDRHHALAHELGDHVEKRSEPLFHASAAVSGYDYASKNGRAIELIKSTANTITRIRAGRGSQPLTDELDVFLDREAAQGQRLSELLEPGPNSLFGDRVDTNVFLENVRKQWEDLKFFDKPKDGEETARQISHILGLRAPAETWTQMRTLNQISAAADLPELAAVQQWFESGMAWFKSGALAYTPATAIRDGFSSFVNAFIIGDQNPATALFKHGKDAAAFARGVAVDPGDNIPEIVAHLKKYGRQNTPETRGQAFQVLWNAHHAGGSIHPNVISADADLMKTANSSMTMVRDIPNVGKEGMWSQVKGAVKEAFWDTKGAYNPLPFSKAGPLGKNGPFSFTKVAGSWTKDDIGRSVRRSESNFFVQTMNSFRSLVDTTNRAMFVLDRLGKTNSLTEAFAMSDMALLNANPKNFSRFEAKYLKNIVPFYSFMRQSIPLFLKELMINPGGKLGMTVRATRLGQGDEKGYVPFQYQDTSAIPISQHEDGSAKYLTSLGLMHEDAVAYAGNALQLDVRGLLQKAISSTNPALKWLTEYSTNTSLHSQGPMGARRLDDLDPTMGRILANAGLGTGEKQLRSPFGPMAESLAAASPLSRLLSMTKIATTDPARSGAAEKVFRLMSGVRIETVTSEQITRDVRDRLNMLQIQSGARPLTTVSGTADLMKHMIERGDVEGAAKLERITKVLSVLRKQVSGKKSREGKPPTTRSLVDRLRTSG